MSLAYQIAKIVSKDEPKKSGDGYLMNCPGHTDNECSAWIADNASGIPSVCCYKTCDKHQIIAGIKSRAPGVWPEHKSKKKEFGIYRECFDYREVDGTVTLRVKRYDKTDGGKEFIPYQPEGPDWVMGRKGWNPILFDLPEVVARVEDSVICDHEGEGKSRSFMAIGILSTTSQGGSNAFKIWLQSKPEIYLKKCKFVAIIPDHDVAGMKLARQKARHYRKHKIPCKIVTFEELMPIREKHGLDGKNLLEKGLTAAEIKKRILDAPFFEDESGDFDHIFEGDPSEVQQKVVPISEDAAVRIDTETWARDYFVRYLGDTAYWTKELGWLIWDGKRYAVDETGAILELAIKAVDQMTRQLTGRAEYLDKWLRNIHMLGKLENIVKLARSKCARSLRDFNQEKHLFNCWNCVVDIRTGEELAHDKKYLFTKITHVSYSKNAEAPTWMEIVHYAMNWDEKMVNFLHRLLGSTLSGSTKDAKVPYFYGDGRNMKSTILEGVLYCHGEFGLGVNKKMFTKNYQETHSESLLHTRDLRFLRTTEIQQGDKLDEAKIKDFSGNEELSARPLYGKLLERWTNQSNLFLMGNHLAAVQGQDIAIWSRLLLVLFPNVISDEERDKFIEEHDGKELGEVLREEAEGILLWLVQGCVLWYQSGLMIPDQVRTSTKDYKGQMDHPGKWLEAATALLADGQTQARIAWFSFLQYMRDGGHNHRGWNETSFGKELTKKFEKKELNGKNYYLGFVVKPDYMPRKHEEPDKETDKTDDD